MIVTDELIEKIDKKIEDRIKDVDLLEYENSKKVMDAFHEFHLSYSDFNETSGYRI